MKVFERMVGRFPKWLIWLFVVLAVLVVEAFVVVGLEVRNLWKAFGWFGPYWPVMILLVLLFFVLAPEKSAVPIVALVLLYWGILRGSLSDSEVQGRGSVADAAWRTAAYWAFCNFISAIVAVYLAEVIYWVLGEFFELPYYGFKEYAWRLALASFFALLPLFYYLRYIAKRKRTFNA